MTKTQLEAVLKGLAELADRRTLVAMPSSSRIPNAITLAVYPDGSGYISEEDADGEEPRLHSFDNLDGLVEALHKEGIHVTSGEQQPPPVRNNQRTVWGMVIEDIHKRDQVGRKRDTLRDAYEKSLDQCAYLRQAIEERDAAKPAD